MIVEHFRLRGLGGALLDGRASTSPFAGAVVGAGLRVGGAVGAAGRASRSTATRETRFDDARAPLHGRRPGVARRRRAWTSSATSSRSTGRRTRSSRSARSGRACASASGLHVGLLVGDRAAPAGSETLRLGASRVGRDGIVGRPGAGATLGIDAPRPAGCGSDDGRRCTSRRLRRPLPRSAADDPALRAPARRACSSACSTRRSSAALARGGVPRGRGGLRARAPRARAPCGSRRARRGAAAAWSAAIADAIAAASRAAGPTSCATARGGRALVDLALGVARRAPRAGLGVAAARALARRRRARRRAAPPPSSSAALAAEPERSSPCSAQVARAGAAAAARRSSHAESASSRSRAPRCGRGRPGRSRRAGPRRPRRASRGRSALATGGGRSPRAGRARVARSSASRRRALGAAGCSTSGGRVALAALAWLEAVPGGRADASTATAVDALARRVARRSRSPAATAALPDGRRAAPTPTRDGSPRTAAAEGAERRRDDAPVPALTPLRRPALPARRARRARRAGGGAARRRRSPRRPLRWTLHRLALTLVPADARRSRGARLRRACRPTPSRPPDDGEPRERRRARRPRRRLASAIARAPARARSTRRSAPTGELLDFVCRRRGEIVVRPGLDRGAAAARRGLRRAPPRRARPRSGLAAVARRRREVRLWLSALVAPAAPRRARAGDSPPRPRGSSERLAELARHAARPGDDGALGVDRALPARDRPPRRADAGRRRRPQPLDRLAAALRPRAGRGRPAACSPGSPRSTRATRRRSARVHPRGEPGPDASGSPRSCSASTPASARELRALLERGAAVALGRRSRSRAPGRSSSARCSSATALWPALHGIDAWPRGVAPPRRRRRRRTGSRSGSRRRGTRAAAARSRGARPSPCSSPPSRERRRARPRAPRSRGARASAAPLELPPAADAPSCCGSPRAHALARGGVPVLVVRAAPSRPARRRASRRSATIPGPVVVCARPGARRAAAAAPVLAVPADAAVAAARAGGCGAPRCPSSPTQAPALAARHPVEPAVAAEAAADVRAAGALDGRAVPVADVAASIRVRAGLSLAAGVEARPPDRAAGTSSCWRADRLRAAARGARAARATRAGVLDDWGFLAGRPGARGVRMLFAGPPGTGKTLSAEVLARELGVDLLVVDISRVVSKWIGETEKNLAEVFDAAERAQAVLLFDEADALFGKRTEVSDAHDRYANLETAYLLSRLERFEGLAVLATNLRQNIDPAFTRRLEFVVDFDEPTRGRARGALALPPARRARRSTRDVDLAQLARALPGRRRRDPQRRGRRRVPRRGRGRRDRARGTSSRAIRREYEKAGRAFPGPTTVTDRHTPQGGPMADTLLGVVQEALAKATDEQKRANGRARRGAGGPRRGAAGAGRRDDEVLDAPGRGDRDPPQDRGDDDRRRRQDAVRRPRREHVEAARAAGGDGRRAGGDRVRASRVAGAQDELARAATAAAEAAATAAVGGEAARRRPHGVGGARRPSTPLSGAPGRGRRDEAGPPRRRRRTPRPTELGGDLPTELLTRAHERRSQRGRPARARSTASARAAEDRARRRGGEGRPRRQASEGEARRRPQRGRRSRTFALTAQERFDRALALLDRRRNGAPLNAAETARVDGARATRRRRPTRSTLENKRDAALKALQDQQAVVDDAILDALAKNPTANPADDAKVKTEQGKLPALETALDTADTTYQAQKDKLDALEAAIPDATWALVADYEEALALLADLADDDPAALATAVRRGTRTPTRRRCGPSRTTRAPCSPSASSRASREDRAAAAAQTRSARLLEALRGDD